MKTLKLFLLITALLVLSAGESYADPRLSILNPTKTTRRFSGSIDQMLITVKPHGTYLENALYLTFSPEGSGYSKETDSLEVELLFDLPEYSFINESWLWFNNIIAQGKLLDRWAAGAIYESYVHRMRTDPSLLFKNAQRDYELRVFPMLANNTRKVKINYFTALNFTDPYIYAETVLKIAKTTFKAPKSIRVLVYNNDEFKNPRFLNDSIVQFTPSDDPLYEGCMEALIPFDRINNMTYLAFDNPVKKGIFFNTGSDAKSNYYQLVFAPKNYISIKANKKVAFLLDFDPKITSSNITKKSVFDNLKKLMHKHLIKGDEFNVFFSNTSIQQYSQNWVQADSMEIEKSLSNLSLLADNTNLEILLSTSIEWIYTKGDTCSIFLIASSDKYGSQTTANKIFEKTIQSIPNYVQIHIADLSTTQYIYYNIGNSYYYNNDYLYSILSAKTVGVFNDIQSYNYSVYNLLDASLASMLGSLEQLQVNTYTTDGFCFSNYNINSSGQSFNYNSYVTNIGKYTGNLPFDVNITGYYRGIPFWKRINVDSTMVSNSNYSIDKIWAANNIKNMENKPKTNTNINEIIFASKDAKILSLYTAFLALEPTKEDTAFSEKKDDGNNVPVELVDFNAELVTNKVLISWATASEINSDRFEVERATMIQSDVSAFSKIATEKASGTSNSLVNYGPVTDYDIQLGNSYVYRIKMIDADGSFAYSEVRIVETGENGSLYVGNPYPNPAKSNLKLEVNFGKNNNYQISVYNLLGSSFALPTNINGNTLSLDVSTLDNGVYSIVIKLDGQSYFRKFTVNR